MSQSLVDYEVEHGVAIIAMNRPEKLNAMNDGLGRQLVTALEEFDSDDRAGVAVLHGRGRAFCSGADMRERLGKSAEQLERDGGPVGPGADTGAFFGRTESWKPIISAVHGYALGVGLLLALETDICVVERHTQLRVVETVHGLPPAKHWAKLAARGSHAFATEVCLTGRPFTAEEARDAGVVSIVVDEGKHLERAVEIAKHIAGLPPRAVRAGVRGRRQGTARLEEILRVDEASNQALYLSEEFRANVAAFGDRKGEHP